MPERGPIELPTSGCTIVDDIAYVTEDQVETSALFEVISARYERRSTLIIANQPLAKWNRIFPDPAMTLAAVDRLVSRASTRPRPTTLTRDNQNRP